MLESVATPGSLAVARHLLAVDLAGPVLTAHDVAGIGRREGTYDLQLLVANRVGREVGRRLHRRDRQQLEQVVLDDVPDRAGLFVEAGPALDAERLGHGDLHVVDVTPVPDRLEDAVGEAEREHVLDRLLAEVVVDAEDLVLGEVRDDVLVQGLGAGEVVPERLLDDQACPSPGPPPGLELVHDRSDRLRRNRQVVNAVPRGATLLVELLQEVHHLLLAAVRGEVRAHVVHSGGEPFPDVLTHLVAPELGRGFTHLLAPRLGRVLRAGDADHGEVPGQEAAELERVERGNQLAMSEIAGGAEDDEGAGIGLDPASRLRRERHLDSGFDLGAHTATGTRYFSFAGLTAWPPNWLRSAALTLAANDSSWREAKRAKSEPAMIGAGTLSSIAARSDQRPSPESST